MSPGERLTGTSGQYTQARPVLSKNAADMPGSRILEGKFITVHQAIGTQKGKPAGLTL